MRPPQAMDRWLYEKATSDSKESGRCLWAMVKQPQHNLKGDAHLFEASGKLLFHVRCALAIYV